MLVKGKFMVVSIEGAQAIRLRRTVALLSGYRSIGFYPQKILLRELKDWVRRFSSSGQDWRSIGR